MPGGIRIELDGEEAVIARLVALGEKAERLARDALQDCVDHVKQRAVEGIRNPPKTGHIYTQRFATSAHGGVFAYGSRTPHQASAPGEYPAADTGNLMRSIWAEVEAGLAGLAADSLDTQLSFSLGDVIEDRASLRGVIGADAEYAAPLEYKPPEKGGRPFLRRALFESEDFIKQRFRQLKGGGGGGSAPPAAPTPTPPAPRPPNTPTPPSISADDLNRAELNRIRQLPPPGSIDPP